MPVLLVILPAHAQDSDNYKKHEAPDKKTNQPRGRPGEVKHRDPEQCREPCKQAIRPRRRVTIAVTGPRQAAGRSREHPSDSPRCVPSAVPQSARQAPPGAGALRGGAGQVPGKGTSRLRSRPGAGAGRPGASSFKPNRAQGPGREHQAARAPPPAHAHLLPAPPTSSQGGVTSSPGPRPGQALVHAH